MAARPCASSQAKGTQKAAICGWATQDTVGELVPNVSGYDPKSLSKIMRDLRPDVEKTAVARDVLTRWGRAARP